jgi:hypothetical protein
VNICDDVRRVGAGLVVRRDVPELAKAILTILDDDRGMGEAGRRLVRERYAPAVVGPAMRRAYEMAISARPTK